MASIVLCLLILLISCFGASATHVGSRSILRVLSPDLQDAAVDFNDTSFDSVLKMTPASFAVVEFFAHWCPACRNYKPHYEKVARLFNGPDAVHPGIILMARVDCALKINIKLCDRFSIGHYPMLLWGPPLKFASGGWEPNQDTSEIRAIDDGRTAERLLNWINKQMDSSYSLDDEKYEYVHHGTNASDPGQLQERKRIYLLKNMTRVPSNLTHEQKK